MCAQCYLRTSVGDKRKHILHNTMVTSCIWPTTQKTHLNVNVDTAIAATWLHVRNVHFRCFMFGSRGPGPRTEVWQCPTSMSPWAHLLTWIGILWDLGTRFLNLKILTHMSSTLGGKNFIPDIHKHEVHMVLDPNPILISYGLVITKQASKKMAWFLEDLLQKCDFHLKPRS
jgi:hypothetical protein